MIRSELFHCDDSESRLTAGGSATELSDQNGQTQKRMATYLSGLPLGPSDAAGLVIQFYKLGDGLIDIHVD